MKKDISEIKKFMINYLKGLGLSDNETNIFYTVLENEQLTILEISRKTGIERTKIYGITDKMRKRGLLEEIIDYKKKRLRACDLAKIQSMIEKKIENVQMLDNSFRAFQKYSDYFKSKHNPTKVLFYRGKDGIKQMLWNELSAKKELFAFTYRHLAEIVGMKFAKKLAMEYQVRNIKIWDIQSNEFLKSLSKKYYPGVFDTMGRYIPPEILDTKIALDVYDDVVCIFNWHRGEVFGVEIHNDKFADFMKQVHKIVWNMGSKEKVR